MLGRGAAVVLILTCVAWAPASRTYAPHQGLPTPSTPFVHTTPPAPPREGVRPGATAPRGEASQSAEPVPDSLPGVAASCADFRSGLPLVIQAQHLLADGTLAQDWSPERSRFCLGSAQGVSSTMVSDGAGGGIVVWVDNRMGDGDLYAQHFAAPDSLAPGWPRDGVPLCIARGSQYGVSLASDGAGGAIAVWTDYRAGGAGDIYAQRLTSAGEPAWGADGIPVCVLPADQGAPAVAADGDGGALIVWQDRRNGAFDLYVQHLTSNGALAPGATEGGDTLITAPGAQVNPTLTGDGEGGAILVWEDRRGADPDLYALRLDTHGKAATGWPAQGVAVTMTPGRQRHPVLASDGAHGAIVAWCDSAGTHAQRVSSAGSVLWAPAGVALCGAGSGPTGPAIVSDSSGGAVVAWEDHRSGTGDIYARRVSGAGIAQWAADGVALCLAGGDQYSVALAPDGAGGALASWVDSRNEARAGFLALQPGHTGPAPKLEAVEVGPGRAKITWRTSKGDTRTFSLRRSVSEAAWQPLGTIHAGPEGQLVAEDRSVPAGSQAQYGLSVPLGGEAEVQFTVVKVEIPLPKPLALRFARSEEGGRVVRVALTLETNEGARLDLFDVAGRRMMTREVGVLGAGDHEVRLVLPGYVRTGVYFIRLGQGKVTRTDRVTVLQ